MPTPRPRVLFALVLAFAIGVLAGGVAVWRAGASDRHLLAAREAELDQVRRQQDEELQRVRADLEKSRRAAKEKRDLTLRTVQEISEWNDQHRKKKE